MLTHLKLGECVGLAIIFVIGKKFKFNIKREFYFICWGLNIRGPILLKVARKPARYNSQTLDSKPRSRSDPMMIAGNYRVENDQLTSCYLFPHMA
jgi:hypothetical protein